ncbi:FeoC-like transcriptional regulator [Bacteroidota bacterium]
MKDLRDDEKSEFFQAMMDKCCENMTEDKAEKMKSSKKSNSGFSGSHPMMGMMSAMMQGRRGAGSGMSMMRKMCSDMMSGNSQTQTDDSFGTSELKDLFLDWLDLLKTEVKNYMKDSGKQSVEDISAHFKLSKESVEFILKNLNQKK